MVKISLKEYLLKQNKMDSKLDIILKKYNQEFLDYIENNRGFTKGFDFEQVFKEIEKNLNNKEDIETILKLNKKLDILFQFEIFRGYQNKNFINFNNEKVVVCK